ncbi:MAG: N-acetylneuraminate synthase [Crocinitomicaceae bacterium]|nr:N-acetylneuraminate synthase [Crocinitomicaceae bacterium]|tara:strand:+ start:1568 stop:2587 length:1020 start_codon:yes stop_codon:yes gene_type:complete
MSSKTLIIAEAGVNFNGDLEIAKQLIDVAADAGADIVKFQTFKAKNLVSKTAKKADYQITNTKNDDSQFSMLKKLELPHDAHSILRDYCSQKGIQFLSTPFDAESLNFLMEFGMDTIKVPSGEITNLPLLKLVASYNKNVIMSSGMANLQEIKDAVKVLVENGTQKENITLLHCNTEYPTPYEDVNLRAMQTIANETGLKVGYSDHTLGIEIPIAAVAMGAQVIEKHFTLSREMDGPDHLASLEPEELKAMVRSIRNIESGFGSTEKVASASEQKNIAIARKSIHYRADMQKGHILREGDLVMKRPGDGISPMLYENYIGKELLRDVQEDEQLTNMDFK